MKPPAEKSGVLPFKRVGNVVQPKKRVRRSGPSVRYFLCDGNRIVYRLPQKLHRALLSGAIALPQFANTRQHVLEVYTTTGAGRTELIAAKGSFYLFRDDGTLDLSPAIEAYASKLEILTSGYGRDRVVDIGPALRYRRWVTRQTWCPSQGLLHKVEAYIKATLSDPSHRVPILRVR